MTAPVANPSRKLKMERIRRRIKALNAQIVEPGADVGLLRASVVAHEAEIAKLRGEAVREAMSGVRADRYAHLWTAYPSKLARS